MKVFPDIIYRLQLHIEIPESDIICCFQTNPDIASIGPPECYIRVIDVI